MKQENTALSELIEEVATLLEATVRAEDGVFHLTVPIESADDEGDEGAGADEAAFHVSVALSTSEDGGALFATRRLCENDGSNDLEDLLRQVSATIHVQLSIDEDEDLVVGGAAPIEAGAEWIADMVGEIAEFALDIAEDAEPPGDDEE